MSYRAGRRAGCLGFALIVLGAAFAGQAQNKLIRLRTGFITTPPKSAVAAGVSSKAISAGPGGLFLIQFDGPLQPSFRDELTALGVRLMQYVPDDAFIVRLGKNPPSTLNALGFVRWVGPYTPDQKIHPRLSKVVATTLAGGGPVPVTVVLTADATSKELSQAGALFSKIHSESPLRQGVIVRGLMPASRVGTLSQLGSVLWIEPTPRRKLLDELAAKIVGGDDGAVATPTLTQQMGFDGSGVTVCVADTGLDTGNAGTMHPDLYGRVTGFQYYGSLTDASDGYGHGTHCAGIVAGNAATGEVDPDYGTFFGLGVASGAKLFIERIFDADANEADPFPSDATLTRDAVRNGADIGSNSWGSDVNGEYDVDAAQFDELVRDADPGTPGDQPYILEFSAGNAGPGSETMDSPATGKNVIATGASENYPNSFAQTYDLYADGPDTMADFSSRGPTQDGRIKPDVVAPGTWIASAASSAALNEAAIAWSPIDNYYVYMGGTSMAGPMVSGAAAVFVQFYKSTHTNAVPSPALVKAALINSATELDESNGGPGPVPNFDEGWGRADLSEIVTDNVNGASRQYQYLDQTVLLSSGQVYEQHVFVENTGEPLKITMDYTDVPAFPGAIQALVNDLDLEVVGPDGTLYRGNQFSGFNSVPNATASDNLNNVEAVHLAQPKPGDYLIRVRARNVPQDARLDTSAIDQDFALVVSGGLARPGQGMIFCDRTAYSVPGTIRLVVLDAGRKGAGAVGVTVKSTTESAGEFYALKPSGNYGAFTGAVATATGPAAVNGKLEVQNGDAIQMDYLDYGGTVRTATATANLFPPAITGVTALNNLGITSISWRTSEPATATVYFGTGFTFNRIASSSSLNVSQLVKLTHLVPGQMYEYYVVSTDAAGNSTTNNNNGSFFSFVAVPAPTILLVDDYDTAGELADDGTPIPVTTYTDSIGATGFSYTTWTVADRGYPQLSDLQGFQIVIWRTTDDLVNYTGTHNTLTADQQDMIQEYLNEGGSFFMASMGVLSQLGDVAFRKNVLQVKSFSLNPDPPSPCSDCDEDYGVPAIVGAAGDEIGNGIHATLDYSLYPSFSLDVDLVYGPDFSDTFTAADVAAPILFESVSGKTCGASYPRFGHDSAGRAVFLSFPLEAIPASGVPPSSEAAFLRRVFTFLAPGANGVGTVALDNTAYTTPDLVNIEMGDSDLAGTGQAQVTISTSSGTNQLTVTLSETLHPGLFAGSVALVATNPATNQFLVQPGDVVTVKYHDASHQADVVATATIDTAPPVITNVLSVSHYGDAQVTWTTSKPADSLVQYGESSLLYRTAYSGVLATNHSVSISGLLANHAYYFQVSSRDAAGNTTVDDNAGALYVLQTLRAPQPPWSDDLESGAKDWTVVTDPGTAPTWQLGRPNNLLEHAAHSGNNAWGSDLSGQQIDLYASCYLISPTIDLTGSSQATLTYWDCYNFSASASVGYPLEEGQLLIRTNSSANLSTLPVLEDFSDTEALGWTLETVDLTPYIGQTIQIVWQYAGVSIGDPTYGWLVDDVGITAVTGGGTIVVKKNLGQGSFTLNGPITRTGTLSDVVISNAPPGVYSVQFDDVAFYQTPPSQSTNLIDGGSISFTGHYGFLDLNTNGISDAWEKYYFGTAPDGRSGSIDSDGDGMSDYAEFLAGTNPADAASVLKFLSSLPATNGVVNLQWSAIPGHLYQVATSTNLEVWIPISGTLQAHGSPMTYTTTNIDTLPHYYKIEVWP